jgi:hypothetical protein
MEATLECPFQLGRRRDDGVSLYITITVTTITIINPIVATITTKTVSRRGDAASFLNDLPNSSHVYLNNQSNEQCKNLNKLNKPQ